MFMDSIESNETYGKLFRIENVRDISKEVTSTGSALNETNEMENIGRKDRRKRDEKIWYNLW